MEVDVFVLTANYNALTIWQGSAISIGVVEHGEFNIVILGIPGRSYEFLKIGMSKQDVKNQARQMTRKKSD